MKIYNLKINFSCEASVNFSTSHKMPRLPRYLQRVATWRSPDNAIRKAAPATRNEATRHWKRPKVTTLAELAIGTAIQASRDRPRTAANGCGRLRTVADVNVERTYPQPPNPQSETGTLATHSGKSAILFDIVSDIYSDLPFHIHCD